MDYITLSCITYKHNIIRLTENVENKPVNIKKDYKMDL